jgi:glutathione peroxidase
MTAIQDIPVNKIDGAPTKLGAYKGKVLLVVNVASKCGLTPQYEGLEKLYEEKRGQGLEILGFPANNFGAQEPGTNEEIATFCSTNYNVQFPMFSKISVKGGDQHPLYAALTEAQPRAAGAGPMLERFKAAGRAPANEADVLWNFEKFLIGRDGQVIGRFAPSVAPNDPALIGAIDAALARPG